MAYTKYIAWLNNTSVAIGTYELVRAKAEEIFHSALWQANEGHKFTMIRITTSGNQRLVNYYYPRH